jgi:hypothetical protein
MSKSKGAFTPAEPRPEGLVLALEPAATVKIADLQREPELQCRAKGTQRRTVAEYAEAMKAGAVFPAIVVFKDGKGALWLADGFHRVAAAELAGVAELPADVREGDRKAALLHAASANSDHGLRRTLADKRAAVQRLLAAYPKWSDRKIAEAAKVDHKTVGAARKLLAPTEPAGGEFPTPTDGDAQPLADPAQPDLAPVYLRTLRAHATREPAEHVQALVRAIIELHAETTPEQIALWVQASPAPAPLARVTPRRRIVQPRGAEANGGA